MNSHRPSGPPGNENAPADDRGARKNLPASNDARPGDTGKPQQDYEDRRNASAFFRNQRKTEDWMPDFVGVAVVEGLGDGDKVWINIREKVSRKGERYLSVTIKRQQS
jgi:hypothetical protein